MSRDRIDMLADELFAAAREERPEREFVARVERATGLEQARGVVDELVQRAGSTPAPSLGQQRPPSSVRPLPQRERALERSAGRRPWLARGLLAAIVCAGVAVLLVPPRPRDAVLISAERARSASGTPLQPRVEPPATRPVTASREGDVSSEVAASERSVRRQPAASADDVRGTPAPESPPEPVPADRPSAAPAPRPRATPPVVPALPVVPAPAAPDTGDESPARETAPAPQAPTLSGELALLKQIRLALRQHDGHAALALLDRHDTGQHGTSLELEARVLRVEALAAVGRRDEAAALARRFVSENPDSPLAERAQRFIEQTDPTRPGAAAQPR